MGYGMGYNASEEESTMINDGWGSKWSSTEKAVEDWIKDASKHPNDYGLDKGNWITHTSDATPIAAGLNGETARANSFHIGWDTQPKLTGLDLATGERTVLTTFEHDGIKHKVIHQTELKQQGFNDPAVTQSIKKLIEDNFDTSKLKQQGSNLIDNDCHLYFKCEGCDTILDPHTKSFRVLQEHRVNAGWKCVWNMNGQGYKVYCEKCGEKI